MWLALLRHASQKYESNIKVNAYPQKPGIIQKKITWYFCTLCKDVNEPQIS
jgi:hypothetical protein